MMVLEREQNLPAEVAVDNRLEEDLVFEGRSRLDATFRDGVTDAIGVGDGEVNLVDLMILRSNPHWQ